MKYLKIFESFKRRRKEELKNRIELGPWQWGIDNNEENIGKYAVLKEFPSMVYNKTLTQSVENELNIFIQSNIGEIKLASKSDIEIHYMIKYEDIPEKLQANFISNVWVDPGKHEPNYIMCKDSEIDFISDNYEECKLFITAKKYNL